MLNIIKTKNEAPTIAEIIDFLQQLPADSFTCTRRAIQYEPTSVSVTSINDPIGSGGTSEIYRIEIELTRS